MRYLRLIPTLTAAVLVLALTARGTTSAAQSETGTLTALGERDRLVTAAQARSIGPEDAKVVLIEFFDFGCSACQEFHRTRGDSLKAILGPDVRFVAMGFLIPRFLRGYHAAEAALCAGALGGAAGYQGMADRLLSRPDEWSDVRDPRSVFARYAREGRLDAAAFADCTEREMVAPVILSDLSISQNFEAQATPTFVAIPSGAEGPDDIGRLEGVVPIAMLQELIATARAKAK
jgi:protein-disulfide isomerase